MVTILHEQQQHEVPAMPGKGSGLWLGAADAERVTGFTLKPQGMCRDEVCVPVPRGAASFVDGEAVDVAAFWRHMGHPVVSDAAGRAWVLGTSHEARRQAMESLAAPDFALPDLEGRLHRLSDYRGKKVFLATWASW